MARRPRVESGAARRNHLGAPMTIMSVTFQKCIELADALSITTRAAEHGDARQRAVLTFHEAGQAIAALACRWRCCDYLAIDPGVGLSDAELVPMADLHLDARVDRDDKRRDWRSIPVRVAGPFQPLGYGGRHRPRPQHVHTIGRPLEAGTATAALPRLTVTGSAYSASVVQARTYHLGARPWCAVPTHVLELRCVA
jgi:hypothetical protein